MHYDLNPASFRRKEHLPSQSNMQRGVDIKCWAHPMFKRLSARPETRRTDTVIRIECLVLLSTPTKWPKYRVWLRAQLFHVVSGDWENLGGS